MWALQATSEPKLTEPLPTGTVLGEGLEGINAHLLRRTVGQLQKMGCLTGAHPDARPVSGPSDVNLA